MKKTVMMVIAVLVLAGPAVNVFAVSDTFANVPYKECPGAYEAKREELFICTKVAGAKEVLSAKIDRKNQIAKLPPFVNDLDAVTLGLMPDDGTDMIYSYKYALYSASGRLIGYAYVHAYANSEMQARIQFLTRYNLQGRLTSIQVKSL